MLVLISICPSAYANGQFPETISQTVSSPANVVIGSDGSARFQVTVEVAYRNLKKGYDILEISLAHLDLDAGLVDGNVQSSPDPCNSPSATQIAACSINPPNSSGNETVTFNVVIPNAKTQTYQIASWSMVHDSFYSESTSIAAASETVFTVTVSN